MPISNTINREPKTVLLSIAAPAYNESENLHALYETVRSVCEKEGLDFELVIAENGSPDGSMDILRELNDNDSRVQYVELSKNFGSQGGLTAALEHCRGDVVISMDADLQHPPSEIPNFLTAWTNGFDIVNSRRTNTDHASVMRHLANVIYFWIMKKTTGIDMNVRQSDFRLYDRVALDAILNLPEREKFFFAA